MHIAMIHLYGNGFPPEIRLEKEAAALVAAGHTVSVFTHMRKGEAGEEIVAPGLKVVRVEMPPPGRLRRTISLFTLQFPEIARPLEDFIAKYKPDVLHVHDIYKLPTILRVARRRRIPVVADLHENVPAAIKAYKAHATPLQKLKRSIVENYYLWQWHEARSLKRCAGVLVVVPEATDRLRGYGVNPGRIVVVSNTEDETTFSRERFAPDASIAEAYGEFWMASYIGGVGAHRGLDTAIRATARIGDRIPGFRLLIVGAKRNQQMELRRLAESAGAAEKVEVIGWQPFDRVMSYMMSSRVCLVPHNLSEHTDTTVPHKLFQYMVCEKPILVSSCRPLQRIVSETGSGLVFKADDADDMAEKLVAMYADPEGIRAMGVRGRAAALGKYAWRHDAQKLLDMYVRIGKEAGLAAGPA